MYTLDPAEVEKGLSNVRVWVFSGLGVPLVMLRMSHLLR